MVHIRRQELLQAGERVGVAVSGGIDSVALLRVLLELRGELGVVLSVVHFNHRLRGAESDGDKEFVAGLAREYELEFYCDGDDVAGHAAEEYVSLETAARELRYGFFRYLVGEGHPQGIKPDSFLAPNGTAEAVPFHETPSGAAESRALSKPTPGAEAPIPDESTDHSAGSTAPPERPRLNKIVTGHTLDDQAETVLMRMIRGAGVRGLGAIYPRIGVEDDEGEISAEIVRPLLRVRHRELERYLAEIGQGWRQDSSNDDERFTRNRVRRLVMPLLEKEFNPSVAENLAELAEIARGEEDYWENEVSGWLGTVVQWSEPEWARAVSDEMRQVQSLVQIAPRRSSSVSSEAADLRSKIADAPWLVMNAAVSRIWFLGEAVAVQRRLVKAIGENAGIPLEFKHVGEILRVAGDEDASGKKLSLPLGWKLVVEADDIEVCDSGFAGAGAAAGLRIRTSGSWAGQRSRGGLVDRGSTGSRGRGGGV